MQLKLKCEGEIIMNPRSAIYTDIDINVPDTTSLLKQIGARGIVEVFDISDLLKLFGEREVIEEIGEEKVLDIIGMYDCISHFKEKDVISCLDDEAMLDVIGEDKVKEYFGLTEIRTEDEDY